MKKVIIYARVSTREQNVDMQITDLHQYAEARKLKVVRLPTKESNLEILFIIGMSIVPKQKVFPFLLFILLFMPSC